MSQHIAGDYKSIQVVEPFGDNIMIKQTKQNERLSQMTASTRSTNVYHTNNTHISGGTSSTNTDSSMSNTTAVVTTSKQQIDRPIIPIQSFVFLYIFINNINLYKI